MIGLLYSTVVFYVSLATMNEQVTSVENEVNEVQSSSRERVLTEKGLAWNIINTKQNFRSDCTAWQKVANSIDVRLTDTADALHIQHLRDDLIQCMVKLSETYNHLCQLLLNSEGKTDILTDGKFDNMESEHRDTMKRIRDYLSHISDDRDSKSSVRSRRSKRSTGSNLSAADLKANAAALRTKLKYVDIENIKMAELERIRTQRDLDITEAKLGVIESEHENVELPLSRYDPIQEYLRSSELNDIKPVSVSDLHTAPAVSAGIDSQNMVFTPTCSGSIITTEVQTSRPIFPISSGATLLPAHTASIDSGLTLPGPSSIYQTSQASATSGIDPLSKPFIPVSSVNAMFLRGNVTPYGDSGPIMHSYVTPSHSALYDTAVGQSTYDLPAPVKDARYSTMLPTIIEDVQNTGVNLHTPISATIKRKPSNLGSFVPHSAPVSNPTNLGSFVPHSSPVRNPTNLGSFVPHSAPVSNPTNLGSFVPHSAPVSNPTNLAGSFIPRSAPVSNPTNLGSFVPHSAPVNNPSNLARSFIPRSAPVSNPSNLTGSFIPHNAPMTMSYGTTPALNTGVNDFTASYQSLFDLSKCLAEQISLTRVPIPEPDKFNGDPITYPSWRSSFEALIERKNFPLEERIHVLKGYLSGPALEAVQNLMMLNTADAYARAKEILEHRFGDPFVIGNAFRDKLESWSKISPRDHRGLRKFADFLLQCEAAMDSISNLQVFNDDRENRKMLHKLPAWVVTRWARKVADAKELHGRFPLFSVFVKFLVKEADIANDPVTALQSFESTDNKVEDKKRYTSFVRDGRKKTARAFASHSEGVDPNTKAKSFSSLRAAPIKVCTFCEKQYHDIDSCRNFLAKPLEERKRFAQTKRLCFGCLDTGHTSRLCKQRLACKECSRRHPTCLHGDLPTGKSFNNRDSNNKIEPTKPGNVLTSVTHLNDSTGTSGKASMIVPVWLSHYDHPDREHLVYCLLDNQSDTTFVLDDTCDALDVSGPSVNLKLSTMLSENQEIESKKIQGLIVRGYDSDVKIHLPSAYTRAIMPADRSHIPTPDMARQWPHLECLVNKLSPLRDCEIGLLIGYNCASALAPREIVSSSGTGPFGQRTDLGWGIIGVVDPNYTNDTDTIGVSHRILTLEVPPELSPNKNIGDSVHFSLKTHIKKSIDLTNVRNMLELDFSEHEPERTALSQEDLKFLDIVRAGIRKLDNNHYELPLPFKESKPRCLSPEEK